ncbi:Charged multivesicular body protein 3, partial [Eschrichtius robustus]|nr:Charged multivesicular body protein 3 [Eschrichtius robustus]
VLRVAGSLQKSTEVMKAMQSLVKIPEIQATMRDLSKEMMKVPWGHPMSWALGKAPSKVTDALPEPELPGAMAASEDEEEEEALEAMQSRLATLRS